MKLTRNHLFLCLATIPLVFHFYFLSTTLINFPSWGDDFLFFELIEHLHKDNFIGFIQFLFKPHNHIHLLVFGKLFVLLGYFIFGSLQIKYLIVTANALLLGILYTFYRYIKNQNYSYAYLIPVACLLVAPTASADNYNLIGVLQHTGSLLFLVTIAYETSKRTHFFLLIGLLLTYPLVSTEGWAMIPCLGIYMGISRHPMAKTVLCLSLGAIAGLGYLVLHQPQVANSQPLIDSLFQAPMALLVFLGNAAWPLSDTYKILLNTSFGASLALLSIWAIRTNARKRSEWEFPLLIWIQVIVTGGMICLGRSQDASITTLILADRFHTYASIAFIVTLLLLISTPNSGKAKVFLFVIPIIYYLGSFFFFHPDRMHSRLRADASNAYYQGAITSYLADSAQMHAFVHAPYFQAVPAELLTINLAKPPQELLIQLAYDRKSPSKYSIRLNNIPNKTIPAQIRWLIVQSISTPKQQFILPFISDKPNQTKILEVNSRQLPDLKQKHLWIYSLEPKRQPMLHYVGTTQ